jgi:hypothetical protein
MRFIFTLTNLRGIPYQYVVKSNASWGQDMTRHGDCMRFVLQGVGKIPMPGPRADEYTLAYPAAGTSKWGSWGDPFALAAVASGAFPIGLAPREITRRTSDYNGELVVLPGGAGEAAVTQAISPNFTPQNPSPGPAYSFVNVDGGTIDNEPVDLCRIELAGGDPLARNQRDGDLADRAVVLIDPFTGPEKAGPASLKEVSLLGLIFNLFGALKDQARFKPEDIALAVDDNIFSRFMVAPMRKAEGEAESGAAIACGSLGGFGGFLSRTFREHDYFLGRRNCQKFLAQHFTLHAANPLFGNWTPAQIAQYQVINGDSAELPIVPLMPSVHPKTNPQPPMDWPVNTVDPYEFEGAIESRLDGLYGTLVSGFRGFFLKIGWVVYLRPKLLAYVLEKMAAGLKAHGLLKP